MIHKYTFKALAIFAALILSTANIAVAGPSSPYPYSRHKSEQPYAQNGSYFAPPARFAQNRAKISSSRAKSAAMAAHPNSEYVNVQLLDGGTYRVRLKKNGRIIDVYVDAYTGRVKN